MVRLGDWNTKSTTELLPHQEYHVKRAAVHEAFNSRSLFNTVALLLLDRNVGTLMCCDVLVSFVRFAAVRHLQFAQCQDRTSTMAIIFVLL